MPVLSFRRFLPFACLATLALGLCSCGQSGQSKPSQKSAPSDPLSKKVETFTGGHTRVVWARYTGKGSDVFANYDKLQLWGLDTRDGKGVRPILEDLANYARPMILPDGSGIVFSRKGTTADKKSGKKRFDPVIQRVDWEGQQIVELGKGYAVDVWRDPKTGTDWVYATDLLPTDRSSIEGSKLERFPLNDPAAKRELVWDKTRISTENIQLSGDGARASCLFPWPDSGVLNLETMRHQKYQHGCWPSMAPDASHHAWVFDGAHKNLFMFSDGAADHWNVAINTAPGMGKHEMYHPRWSNHVRFLSLTGPYTGPTPTQSDTEKVEVLIGKFSPDLKKIEDWLQITDDQSGDLFPDLWIEGGELASLETKAPAPVTHSDTATPKGRWPVGDGPFAFVWENRDSDNTVAGTGSRVSSVEAKQKARFGPHFEMLTDGGYFVPDSASSEAIRDIRDAKPFTLEAQITPRTVPQTGDILFATSMRLGQIGDRLGFALPGEGFQDLGSLKPGVPTHVAVTFDGKALQVFRDGKPVQPSKSENAAPGPNAAGQGAGLPEPRLAFGLGWSGAIEGVAIRPIAASPESIAATADHWRKAVAARKAIPTLRLRGKLVEMTANRPVEALDTYQRALLGYLYEVEKVLDGEFNDKQIAVMHWTILDRQPLPGFPREIGKSYELILQPAADHPELVSERQWNDLLDPLEPWFDISPP
ncbi:MAG: hypothetical protein KDM63_03805 [Verrucomicrobiae bacterium]|nr:hypothetical protein [Verrucomicrobiae bacterium]